MCVQGQKRDPSTSVFICTLAKICGMHEMNETKQEWSELVLETFEN